MLPIEVFAAKGPDGQTATIVLAAALDCGLRGADTLRVDGNRLVPLRGGVVLPLTLPALDATSLEWVRSAARSAGRLSVGEFTALGLAHSYELALQVMAKPTEARR
jgi:hypothetical protein